MTQWQYHSKARAEHLIASGRVILAAFFLLAIYVDPSEPFRYAALTYGILSGYVGYSLLVAVLVWRRSFNWQPLEVFTHSVDLAVFACLMFLTAGPNSPFFVYFIFILVCATFRWQWRGILCTALTTLAVIIFLAWYPANLLHDNDFELNRFIIRIVYLMVIAIMLGYLGAYEQSLRKTLSMLAEWPGEKPFAQDPSTTVEMLHHAAAILGAPRIVLIWEEEEEPWLHVVSWTAQECRYDRERPDTFKEIVHEQLAEGGFFCRNVSNPHVVWTSPRGLKAWQGVPLDEGFVKRFAVTSVCVSRLQGKEISGHLFTLDKKQLTSDDLVLGEIVAHEIATRLDHNLLLRQLQHSAANEERIRLSRDLHDGLLQSLTACNLQLEAAQRLLQTDPQAAREYMNRIQQLLSSEQRDLRVQINDLKPLGSSLPGEFGLLKRLHDLAERIRSQWNISCSITTPATIPRLPRSTAREIYFVIHEALINAAKHAEASHLQADLSFSTEWAHIKITDDGSGFAFHGSYDQDQLADLKRGPVILRERVNALNGRLLIESRENGARLDITLPLTD
jgi:signal transduction histidine kinase